MKHHEDKSAMTPQEAEKRKQEKRETRSQTMFALRCVLSAYLLVGERRTEQLLQRQLHRCRRRAALQLRLGCEADKQRRPIAALQHPVLDPIFLLVRFVRHPVRRDQDASACLQHITQLLQHGKQVFVRRRLCHRCDGLGQFFVHCLVHSALLLYFSAAALGGALSIVALLYHARRGNDKAV